MKKNKIYLTATGLVFGLLFSLYSCKEDEKMSDAKTKFRIEDFKQQQNFWDYSAGDGLIKEGKLGSTPENAFVPIIFNENGILVTAEEYNNQAFSELQYFATDLATFYNVTKEATAKPDYALVLGFQNEKPVYAYDPYSKEKITREADFNKILEIMKDAPVASDQEKLSKVAAVTGFDAGDLIVRPNSGNLYDSSPIPANSIAESTAGHAVGVTLGLMSSQDMTALLKTTSIVEAFGYDAAAACQIRETKACVSGASKSCTNNPIQNNNYWDLYKKSRFRLRTGLSATQKSSIASFLRAQDPDTYSIAVAKRFKCSPPKPCSGKNCPPIPACATSAWANGTSWYCSLLVWQSYLFATGIDIDSNGGNIVYPNDLINSKIFNGAEQRLRF